MNTLDTKVTVIICTNEDLIVEEFIVMETKSEDERMPEAREVIAVCEAVYGRRHVTVYDNVNTYLNLLPKNIDEAIEAYRKNENRKKKIDLKKFQTIPWSANISRKEEAKRRKEQQNEQIRI